MMTALKTFPPQTRVAVIGASGGIGQALVALFASDPRVERVFALSRTPCPVASPKIIQGELDLEDEASIVNCAASLSSDSVLDIVVVATGILWSGEQLRPEKSMRELDMDKLAEVLAINTIGPALVAKHFLPTLRKGSKTIFAALSARVGSIGDNRLGGWYSYRASKAALNMLLKTLSIEHARQWPQSVIVGLHPGTVTTELSTPFTKRTPPEKLFSPEISAGHLLKVLDAVTLEDSGGVFAWDGQRVEN
jgi:NAD(P)-dependent dehydrogenase (short-subunit alcohol dehydrogenase family)